jgi:hypothetical protein
VVTVFAGDVLARLCAGLQLGIHAPLHRVVAASETEVT